MGAVRPNERSLRVIELSYLAANQMVGDGEDANDEGENVEFFVGEYIELVP